MVDILMTWLLRIVFYGIQLGGFVLIAFGPAKLLSGKNRRLLAVFLAVFLLLECGLACMLTNQPIVSVPEKFKGFVTQEQREEIQSYSRGVYSANIPIFPVCAAVTHADEQELRFVIHYLFWGSVEMRITEDGPGITRPLFSS